MLDKLREQKQEREISARFVVLAVIFWILTVSWIVVIFQLSSDTAEESSEFSHTILDYINELFSTNIQDDSILRMVGHSAEYALLTLLSFLALSSTNKISSKTSYAESPVKLLRSDNEMNIIFTLWFTVLNAIFDEYHQLFVIGRDGSIIDVLIDLIGIVLVLVIIRIAFSIYIRTKGRTEIVYT